MMSDFTETKIIEQHGLPSEGEEQYRFGQWLDRHQIIWCHVPNEGPRTKREAARQKRLGLRAGIPDVLIFSKIPNAPADYPRGVAIEFKRRNSGRITASQIKWRKDLIACGWIHRVCSGAREAHEWLVSLGYGGRH